MTHEGRVGRKGGEKGMKNGPKGLQSRVRCLVATVAVANLQSSGVVRRRQQREKERRGRLESISGCEKEKEGCQNSFKVSSPPTSRRTTY